LDCSNAIHNEEGNLGLGLRLKPKLPQANVHQHRTRLHLVLVIRTQISNSSFVISRSFDRCHRKKVLYSDKKMKFLLQACICYKKVSRTC
jgi:hypothetical protein